MALQARNVLKVNAKVFGIFARAMWSQLILSSMFLPTTIRCASTVFLDGVGSVYDQGERWDVESDALR